MNMIDMYCDTLMYAQYHHRDVSFLKHTQNVRWTSNVCGNRVTMRSFFAAFIYTADFPKNTAMDEGYAMAMKMFDMFDASCQECQALVRKVRSGAELLSELPRVSE